MKADEAAEMMDTDKAKDKAKQRSAIVIAIFAMLLAITGLGGQNASKETLNNNILASNAFNFYQAKNIRQTSVNLAADEIEFTTLTTPGLSDAAKAALSKKLESYKATVARYESEPATGEGKKELSARALALEAARDHAARQDPYFDVSDALLQIAIVLCSVSIIAISATLFWASMAIAGLGALLMLNGFTLAVALPILG